MLNPVQTVIKAPSKENMEMKIQSQTMALNRIENYFQTQELSFVDKEELEIGTLDG